MSKRCLGCMELFGDEFEICPHCGYVVGTGAEEAIHMEPGVILHDRYIVGKVLGHGGFGVTYIGWDGKLEQKVAIKEYLPGEFSTRMPGQSRVTVFNGEKNEQFHDGLSKFVEEAKHLAKFINEQGIVKIFDSFEENETAYIIMEYLDGETLTDYLKREKTIPEDQAVKMLMPVMESLQTVHTEGLLHRDIAPDNIFLCKNGAVKLIDFGASRYATTSHSRSLTVIIKPGYSPEEQYRSRGDQGSYTDVYAIAATLYKMITGKTPPDAMERRTKYESQSKDILEEPHKLTKKMSLNREIAILNAMNVRIEDRTPDVSTFMNELNADPPAKRRYGKIKKIDLYHLPMWLKILVPSTLAAVALLVTLLLTGVIKFSLFSEEIVIPEGIVTVPDVEGLYSDEAIALIEKGQLLALTDGTIESEYIAAGKIILQSPIGGSYMDINGTVMLTVSSGKGVQEAVDGISTVPYVIWETKDEAIAKLKQAGLAEPAIEEKYDENVAFGQVISQSIKAGEKVKENTPITLVISLGAQSFEIPNVEGKLFTEAKSILEARGLIVNIAYKKDSNIAENNVISQSIGSGTQVKRGDEVTIVVSSGKTTVEVVNVVGKSQADAEEALQKQGFKVTVLENYDVNIAAGLVISQTPDAGSSQIANSTITIYVSKGKQPVTLTFDANAGSVNTKKITVYYGSTYGDLPTPTRSGSVFVGWYTSASGGNRVNPSSIVVTSSAHTLYAQWSSKAYTLTFDAAGGNVPEERRSVAYGASYGPLPTPSRSGYTFNGWYTAVSGGSKVTASTIMNDANVTVYARWTQSSYTVSFNGNGGVSASSSKTVAFGEDYGNLPNASRDYYNFLGWYTSASGGNKISASTRFNSTNNVTLYAHWELKPTSGWTLASNMPSGAQVVKQKWTYDLTTNITSDKSSVEGYTLYDTKSEWGSYGAWSSWSKSVATGSDSKQVETKTVTDKAGYTNYKYWIYRSADHHTYGTKGYNGVCWNYEEINLNYALQLKNASLGLYGDYNCGHGYSWSNLWFSGGSSWVPAVTHIEYRYRTRTLIYTYYHTKTESKESSAEVTPSGTISNVQKYVMYRAK